MSTVSFIPADCGDPPSPMNGFVTESESTLEGSQIVFQCSSGFAPSQQRTSVCMADGNWSPDPAGLVCKGIGSIANLLKELEMINSF